MGLLEKVQIVSIPQGQDPDQFLKELEKNALLNYLKERKTPNFQKSKILSPRNLTKIRHFSTSSDDPQGLILKRTSNTIEVGTPSLLADDKFSKLFQTTAETANVSKFTVEVLQHANMKFRTDANLSSVIPVSVPEKKPVIFQKILDQIPYGEGKSKTDKLKSFLANWEKCVVDGQQFDDGLVVSCAKLLVDYCQKALEVEQGTTSESLTQPEPPVDVLLGSLLQALYTSELSFRVLPKPLIHLNLRGGNVVVQISCVPDYGVIANNKFYAAGSEAKFAVASKGQIGGEGFMLATANLASMVDPVFRPLPILNLQGSHLSVAMCTYPPEYLMDAWRLQQPKHPAFVHMLTPHKSSELGFDLLTTERAQALDMLLAVKGFTLLDHVSACSVYNPACLFQDDKQEPPLSVL